MVTALIGLPGVGKSLILSYIAHLYTVGKSPNNCKLCVSSQKKYDRLYTNFEFEGAYKLDFDKLGIAYYNNALMLCDEIQLFADSRNFKQFGDNLTYWFSNHRKDHLDFIYCTQDYSFVDKRIRSITDRVYVLERTIFGLLRVREVLSSFDLSTLGQKHVFSARSRYYIPPLLYKYNNTDYHIKFPYTEDAPSEKW